MDGSLTEEVSFCVVEVTVMLGGARPLHVCMYVYMYLCVCVCVCVRVSICDWWMALCEKR
jgi:hypothetical protein